MRVQVPHIFIHTLRVYFKISLKRGKTHCGKFQEGANPNPKGEQPHIKYRESQLPGGGQINPKEGQMHSLAPPLK